MNRRSKIKTEQELKNIDLDAGQVVATAAVGPTPLDIENSSPISFTELPLLAQQELNHVCQYNNDFIVKIDHKFRKRHFRKARGTVIRRIRKLLKKRK